MDEGFVVPATTDNRRHLRLVAATGDDAISEIERIAGRLTQICARLPAGTASRCEIEAALARYRDLIG